MHLRHKLFLAFALLTSVPLIVLLGVTIERAEQEVKAGLDKGLHVTLDKMAGELDVLLNDQAAMARGLSRVPALRHFARVARDGEPQRYRRAAERLEQFFLNYQHAVPSIQALRFIEPGGRTLVKVKEGKIIEPKRREPDLPWLFVADQSNKRFFRHAMENPRDVTMSDYELGQVTVDADFCPAMVRYTVKIRDEVDNLLGLLVVNMWGTQVDKRVRAALGGYPGVPYVVELNDADPARDGIFLYHPDNSRRFANQLGTGHRLSAELSAEEWRYLKTTASGSIFQPSGHMLFFRHFVPDPDKPARWALVIRAEADTVLAPINSMRRWVWWLLGLVLFLSLGVAVWLAARLARPMHELAGILKRYADGDRSVRYTRGRRDEIGVAGRAFNYLAEALDRARRERDKAEQAVRQSERLAAVGQLAAGIGHEINNPLMNIMSLGALVEKAVAGRDPQAHSDIQLLLKEGRRCARIVQGILNFARESTPCFRRFDLVELVRDTAGLMHHRLESARLKLALDLPEALEMHGDPNLLQQVLVNVLLNAIQASPAGGTIEIRVRREDGQVEVEVLDRGTGIHGANLSQVLDPFFTTKPEGDGTGLGLSVSYGIVKEHGGEITLENRPEGGVRVCIRLPLAPPVEEEESDEDWEEANVG